MNDITEIVTAYKPERFISLDIPLTDLQDYLVLSHSEAQILKVLLREYKAHKSQFNVRAIRQHIFSMRKKLYYKFEDEIIENSGMGIYFVSDFNKGVINGYIETVKELNK